MEYMKRGSPTPQRGELLNEGSISLNRGESIDAYKEKVEHFKVLVMHLQNELQNNKMRKEGAETVSKLLQESKKDGLCLQRKIKTLESAIRNLQSRLELHGLSTEITLHEGETYIPSHSKQLLDNLTRENTRLRGLIRNASGDPEEIDRLQKEIQSLNNKNDESLLQQEGLQAKITELEDVLKASDNDKDATIKRLRDELAAADEELSKTGYKCLSLAEERTTLQNQLQEVAQKCQELAMKLEKQRSDARAPVETELKQKASDSSEALVKLQEDNTLLNAKVKEITEMNKRWQEYNQQRESSMTQLQKELTDMKESEKLHETKMTKLERSMQEQLHRILEDTQTRANQEVHKAHQERDQYKQKFEECTRKMTQMTQQIGQLQKQGQVPVTSPGAEPEIIEALKQQIQICTEDFESERKDREKVQSKLHRALSENEHLKKEVEMIKRERSVVTPQFKDQQQYNDPFYHYQLPGPHGNFGGENLAARGGSAKNIQYFNKDRYNVIDGISTDFQADSGVVNTAGEKDITDQSDQGQLLSINSKDSDDRFCSLKSFSSSSDHAKVDEHKTKSISPRNSSSSPRNSSSSNRSSSVNNSVRIRTSIDILKCPKCDREYGSDEHADLLEHIEMCCE